MIALDAINKIMFFQYSIDFTFTECKYHNYQIQQVAKKIGMYAKF